VGPAGEGGDGFSTARALGAACAGGGGVGGDWGLVGRKAGWAALGPQRGGEKRGGRLGRARGEGAGPNGEARGERKEKGFSFFFKSR
jgi:hypothetical protein